MLALCVSASSAGANSLLLHYSFDGSAADSSMLAVDSSGNGYDAIMTGFPKSSGDVPISLAGGASCLLSGGRQHGSWMDVNVADPSVLAPANYTIAFWTKPSGLGSMMIAGNYTAAGYGTEICVRSSGEMRFYHNGEYLFRDKETGVVFDTEKWTHVAITVDTVNNVQSLYVDGALRLTKTSKLAPMAEGLTRIGNRNADYIAADKIHGTSYRGLLDDFRFYDYPLTAAEVKTLAAPPLLHYSFDGSVGSTSALTVDSSPNGYDGILSGVPVGSTEVPGSVEVGDSWQGVRGDWMDIELADPSVLAPENYTIAFWAKPSAYANSAIAATHALSGAGTLVCTSGGGELRFYHNGAKLIDETETGVVFDTEKWTHVAVAVNTVSDTLSLYVNGVLRLSKTGLSLAPMDAGLSRIGSIDTDGTDYSSFAYQGLLDEFYFYDYAMGAEQVGAVGKMKTFVLYPPNGDTIPKIMGANGSAAVATGFDYFDWFGFTHMRAWHSYKGFPTRPNDGYVTSPELFIESIERVDAEPDRQADGILDDDIFIDWSEFHREMKKYHVDDGLNALARSEDIEIMLCNREMFFEPGTKEADDLRGDWPRTFTYWKSWYALVYYMAQNYEIEMYQCDNEPWSAAHFEAWEYNWLVAAHAMRMAMAKVNTIRAENQLDPLKLEILGPTAPNAYWDPGFDRTMLPNYENAHRDVRKGWGNISWDKIKYDMFGAYDPGNESNYTMYDYHHYNTSAAAFEGAIMGVRHGMTFADNDPDPTMPIVITEMNTGTGRGLTNAALDTEDLTIGISIAQIMQTTGVLGQSGLGAEGGMFVFKTSARRGKVGPHSGIANQFYYGSYAPTVNGGGVTRGGAALQMYTRNFRGGKEIVPHALHNSDADTKHRMVSVVDDVRNQYYVYGSNVTGGDEFVTFDFSHLDVASGTPIAVQRVGAYNTGQVTEVIALDASKKLILSVSNLSAYLLTVPKGESAAYETLVAPTHDKTQNVTGVDDDPTGTNPELLVSLHSSVASERRAALMRFELSDVDTVNRALLKLSGRNVGTDQTEREILHVYAVPNADWNEGTDLEWTAAPGVGRYITDLTYAATPTWATADGLGPMLDIEDNYGGFEVTLDESGQDVFTPTGAGLGIYGQFVGALSFYSGDYQTNYLDVTDYIKSHANGSSADVTFVVVRIVRYKISEFSNAYYDPTDLHYDGRIVEIASKEHLAASLQPALVVTSASLPPAFNTDSINAAGATEDAAYTATLAD